jgi:excinuclease ABC subunit A
LPRDALVVFSGVSGSGKSSLAFGTHYAEAQRRRLIDEAGVPEFDSITGLPPAVALRQQRGTPGSRSSVGSITTISSSLRMLYSRAAPIRRASPCCSPKTSRPTPSRVRVPPAPVLGRSYEVTERALVPDDSLTIRERAIAAWPPAWHEQNLRDILVTLGQDVDTPWRDLPKKVRAWTLFTDERPNVPVHGGFTPAGTQAALRSKMEPSYQCSAPLRPRRATS